MDQGSGSHDDDILGALERRYAEMARTSQPTTPVLPPAQKASPSQSMWVVAGAVAAVVIVLAFVFSGGPPADGTLPPTGGLSGGTQMAQSGSVATGPAVSEPAGGSSAEDAIVTYLRACIAGDLDQAWDCRTPEYRATYSEGDLMATSESYDAEADSTYVVSEFTDLPASGARPIDITILNDLDMFEYVESSPDRVEVQFSACIGVEWFWFGRVIATRLSTGWFIESAALSDGSGA